MTFLLQSNIIFKFPSRYTAVEYASLPAYSPHSHTQFPRTSFPIQLLHQVSLADHTESPPPAKSLLGPNCHPAGSTLSLIDDPTGSASDTPAFPSRDQLLVLHCACNLFFHTPKASFTSQGLFSAPLPGLSVLRRLNVPSKRAVGPSLERNVGSSRPRRLGAQ